VKRLLIGDDGSPCSEASKRRMTEAAKAANGAQHSQLVHFELLNVPAETVSIAGSFNDWHPSVTPMISLGEGRWVKELTLPPGTYEYRFVVDGEWVHDQCATEAVINPYGGLNSVLKVMAYGRCLPA
jgi:1,4-alpha-glucan branching enzyme